MKAMSREARIRYATAQEFGEDLERFLKGQTARAAGGGSSGALHKVIGIAAAVALIGGATYFGMEFWKQRGSSSPTVPPTAPAADKSRRSRQFLSLKPGRHRECPRREERTRPNRRQALPFRQTRVPQTRASRPAAAVPRRQPTPHQARALPPALPLAPTPTPPPHRPLHSRRIRFLPRRPTLPPPAVVEGLEEARDRYASVAAKAAAVNRWWPK